VLAANPALFALMIQRFSSIYSKHQVQTAEP